MLMIKFTLKLKPVTKKNNPQILKNRVTGKRFVAPSKQYQEYEEAALWLIPKYRQPPINYPVNVKCLFYMPTKQKCDLTNLLEAIDDVMVKARLLADDNYTIIASHDGSRVLYDKDNPRTEVEITPIKKEAAADVVFVEKLEQFKKEIISPMTEVMSEYMKHGSGADYYAGKSESMETAMSIVRAAFNNLLDDTGKKKEGAENG